MLRAVPRAFRVIFAVGALLLVVQLAVLTHFVVDPGADQWLAGVWRPWRSAHSCVSAYWVAAREATRVDDLYVEAVYRKPIAPTALRRPNLGPFFVDVFEYPPTFLPLPRLLALATPDFWQFRRLWFALNLGAVVLGLIAVARRFDAPLQTQALWAMLLPTTAGPTPLPIWAVATFTTLQTAAVVGLMALAIRAARAGSGPTTVVASTPGR